MSDPNSPLFRFQMWRMGLPPALRLLLTVNLATYLVVVFLALLALFGVPVLAVADWLTLPADPLLVLRRPWTPFTYGFVNLYPGFFGLISFAFGFLWLSWMGRDYEESYGAHRLFGVYMVSALGGAALAVALGGVAAATGAAVPALFRPYFGLWTPVTGVLCAYATLHPNRGIGLFLLGVVPLKWVAVGFVVLSLVFSADLTVLGAALAGYAFGRAQQNGTDLASWARPLFDRTPRARAEPAPRRSSVARAAPPARQRSGRGAGRRGADRPGLTDVDAILDKILDKGYDSLTDEERQILDRASRD
jgi:membrane associated rhomboid family serine protease